MGLLDEIRGGTYVADDAPPLVVPGERLTLRVAGTRIARGEDSLLVAREFLDHAGRADDGQIVAMICDRPNLTGDRRADALLAAIGEYAASIRGVGAPAWMSEPGRFLDTFWFVSSITGLRATAVAQTPVALKRRGIFWPARSLMRV